MNAPEDKLAQLLTLTREPFPASRKSWIVGSRADVRVPVREVSLTNGEVVSLYDTSGPYTDPDAAHRRAAWPARRAQRLDRRAQRHRALRRAPAPGARRRREARGARLAAHRAAARRRRRAAAATAPRQERRQRHADALRAPRHRHAGDGIRRAARERQARMDGRIPRRHCARTAPAPATRWVRACRAARSRPSSCATRWRAAAPSFRPTSTIPKSSRWRSAATSWSRSTPTSATRRSRRASRKRSKSSSGRSAGARDTVMDLSTGKQHPHHARLDRAQLAGADRHGADLPGAREGRRRRRRPDVGDLPRHADRAGRAGRRLLHHPRRRAAAVHPPHRQPPHRHRLARRLDHGQVVHRASPRELPVHALRRDLRNHEGLRRELLARRRPAPRLGRRRQRRGAVRRAAHAGRADAASPGSTTCRP